MKRKKKERKKEKSKGERRGESRAEQSRAEQSRAEREREKKKETERERERERRERRGDFGEILFCGYHPLSHGVQCDMGSFFNWVAVGTADGLLFLSSLLLLFSDL